MVDPVCEGEGKDTLVAGGVHGAEGLIIVQFWFLAGGCAINRCCGHSICAYSRLISNLLAGQSDLQQHGCVVCQPPHSQGTAGQGVGQGGGGVVVHSLLVAGGRECQDCPGSYCTIARLDEVAVSMGMVTVGGYLRVVAQTHVVTQFVAQTKVTQSAHLLDDGDGESGAYSVHPRHATAVKVRREKDGKVGRVTQYFGTFLHVRECINERACVRDVTDGGGLDTEASHCERHSAVGVALVCLGERLGRRRWIRRRCTWITKGRKGNRQAPGQ